jgi:hypothetical protein
MFPKLLDGSFNGNSTSTNFGGGPAFTTPTQPSAKLLDNWFNGNKTGVNVCPKSLGSADVRLMMPM